MTKYVKVSGAIEGGDQLLAEMQALGLSVKGTTRKAVRAGTKAIQVSADRRAAVLSGRRGKPTKIKISARSKTQVRGDLLPSDKKFFLRFFERGTKPHVITQHFKRGQRFITRRIQHPGMRVRPWLRPAFDESVWPAQQAYADEMKTAILTRRAQLDNGPDEER